MPRPRIGSLFSGAGGLDLAVEHVTGGRTVWHCETDLDASKVLDTRWPGVPNLGDITLVDWAYVAEVAPIEVLCGGFPCQDVSAAGRRAGIAVGTRSGLWLEYAEAINQLRPQLVVIENVRGLLSGYAHRAMEPGADDLGDRSSRPLLRAAGAVLGDLADLGYDAQWTTVAASDVGAPHRRERVFIVAHPAGGGRPDEQKRSDAQGLDVFTESGAGDRDSARGAAARVHQLGRSADELAALDLLPTPSVADGMGGHLSRSGARSDELLLPGVAKAYAEGALLPTPTSRDHKGAANPPGRVRDGRARTAGDDMLPDAVMALLPTPRTTDANGAGTHGDGGPDLRTVVTTSTQWGKYAPAIHRWETITRCAPSPTEPGAKGNPRLAAPFSEWMIGYPLGWITDVAISRSAMLRIIGNSVCPQQAIAALQWLFNIEAAAA